MGKFIELYKFCQGLEPKISTRVLDEKVEELTKSKVKVMKTTLDVQHCRGLFISVNNTSSNFAKWAEVNNVIVLARGQNPCWDRFVHTKELMHLFDNHDEATFSEALFDRLLSELVLPSTNGTNALQVNSEIKSFWMALACLCPEKHRQEYILQKAKGHMDDYTIALQLRIPEKYIPALLSERYIKIIQSLTTVSM